MEQCRGCVFRCKNICKLKNIYIEDVDYYNCWFNKDSKSFESDNREEIFKMTDEEWYEAHEKWMNGEDEDL